jgi:hypothetical protein
MDGMGMKGLVVVECVVVVSLRERRGVVVF